MDSIAPTHRIETSSLQRASRRRVLSLRVRLLLTIGVSLAVLWGGVAGWMYLDIRKELHAALDDKLAGSARMVASLVSRLPSSPGPAEDLPEAALDVAAEDGLACEVSSMSGGAIARTLGRTLGSPRLAKAQLGFGTHVFGGERWRTYVLQEGDIRVATADRLDLRRNLLRDIALTAAVPFVTALLGSMLLLWLAIGRGLAPIEAVRNALAARRPEDTTSLHDSGVAAPPELLPLVETVEQLLARVGATVARERRFTDDAAHELRTPLTALKTHLQVASLTNGRGEAEKGGESLAQAQQAVLRLQRTLEQLLLLARLDGGVEADSDDAALAGEAARQAAGDAMAAHGGHVCVTMKDIPEHVRVALPEALLVVALRNLLDNALRFAPDGTTVECHVERISGGAVTFTVLDEGPGMSEADCLKAAERFWRRGPRSDGSGLGLSIVTAIAAFAGGEVRLQGKEGRGLAARFIVPTADGRREALDSRRVASSSEVHASIPPGPRRELP